MVNDQSLRAAGSMELIYSMHDMVFKTLSDLKKLCIKLDTGFFEGSKYSLRVHGLYYKIGDKYVNISCRLKNCQFRINHVFEKDKNGEPKMIKYY